MYRGKNVTAIQSQRWLGDALITLMKEKAYSTITIADICKRADLSRQTFYNVFDNKDEIIRFCLRVNYEKQLRMLENQETLSVKEMVDAFISVLNESKELLNDIVNNNLENLLADELTQCISLFAGKLVRKEQQDELFPYSEIMLSGALGQLLVYWIRQDEPISTEKMAVLITNFLNGKLYVPLDT